MQQDNIRERLELQKSLVEDNNRERMKMHKSNGVKSSKGFKHKSCKFCKVTFPPSLLDLHYTICKDNQQDGAQDDDDNASDDDNRSLNNDFITLICTL